MSVQALIEQLEILDEDIEKLVNALDSVAQDQLRIKITSSITLNVSIASIAAGVVFDVKITSSAVTLDVNIASSDVTLNVNVQGTVSISIDQANVYLNVKHENFKCAARWLQNHGDEPPPYYDGGTLGKLFPNGARGFINRIDVYVKDYGGSGGQVRVYITPYPNLAPIGYSTINIDAGYEGWKSFYLRYWWPYDSLFVYVKCIQGDIRFGYDLGTPNDYFWYYSAIDRFVLEYRRLYVKVHIAGQSAGGLPVFGTVNVIQLPNKATSGGGVWDTVSPEGWITIAEIEGTGKTTWIQLRTNYDSMRFYVEVDGENLVLEGNDYISPLYLRAAMGYTVGVGGLGINLVTYDDSNHRYVIIITLPIEFRRKLRVRAYNPDTASSHAVRGTVWVSKIE